MSLSQYQQLTKSLFATGAICLALWSGCGRRDSLDVAAVKGRVLLNGSPVEFGIVSFIPQPGVPAPNGGGKITNGSFEIPASQGLVKGEYRIEITVIPQRPPGVEAPPPPKTLTDPNAKPDKWALENPVREFKDSTQTFILKAGANDYEIDLKSEKNRDTR